ncbi:MAG TPA: DUF2147 domain-containing protein [Bacteroidales bacterium]|jgi:uncharacterized protein (DUF2147 family)|nr:DUF2147 domain-containing protein [Bacteroidales bacterium]HNZ42560.1 DUF2147 domain-containing protein [Bacteroidales bacterium]HOH83558.1 DUF2147 domain-containing protein [Bacteroidales bacterium]HPB24365.1 DUF2147 domain-containing protein [Bacteroidales bacterium]HPI29032.1 DUF2147 domain-containing protein [Bacteroidales bacterium]
MPAKPKSIISVLLFAFLFCCFFLLPNFSTAQNSYGSDALCGEWWTPERQGRIIFFKNGSTYSGKVAWMKKSIDPETGKPMLDKHNPNPSLRNRPITGMVLFYDFKYNASKDKYVDGSLYDSDHGNTYSCWIKLIDKDVLELHGYIGFSLIGKSVYFTRVKK